MLCKRCYRVTTNLLKDTNSKSSTTSPELDHSGVNSSGTDLTDYEREANGQAVTSANLVLVIWSVFLSPFGLEVYVILHCIYCNMHYNEL